MDRSRCAPFRRAHRLRRIAFWTVTFLPYGILSLFAFRRARALCQATSLFGSRDLVRPVDVCCLLAPAEGGVLQVALRIGLQADRLRIFCAHWSLFSEIEGGIMAETMPIQPVSSEPLAEIVCVCRKPIYYLHKVKRLKVTNKCVESISF